jgi:crossover junction endodeoxyribonuclease RuvC
MIILGIDPGTRRVGYGVVERAGGGLNFVEAGLLKIKSRDNLDALKEIKKQTDKLIKKFKPEVLAIEKLFFMRNQKTGIQVAEARGVILLSAAENKLKILEYAPNEIKAGVAGYGLADKKAVLKIVKLLLGQPNLKIIDDASDALAAAILAAQKRGLAG